MDMKKFSLVSGIFVGLINCIIGFISVFSKMKSCHLFRKCLLWSVVKGCHHVDHPRGHHRHLLVSLSLFSLGLKCSVVVTDSISV